MAAKKLHLHIKNNRAGEEVFRTTPALYRAAARRHPETARQIRVTIDWDLDNFEQAMGTADALVTWDLPQQDLRQRAPGLKYIHIIGAGVEHLAPFHWLPRGLALVGWCGVGKAQGKALQIKVSLVDMEGGTAVGVGIILGSCGNLTRIL